MIDLNNLPSPADFRHCTPLQLRFNDVDVLGHVNNEMYFAYMDLGKMRYFQDMSTIPYTSLSTTPARPIISPPCAATRWTGSMWTR
jgi:acyl-CoA thioesterase FadM